MSRVANSVLREYQDERGNNGATDCCYEADEEEHCGLIAKNLPIGWRPGSHTIYYLSRL